MGFISIRMLGILLLVGAGSTIGFYKAYQLKRRIEEIIMLQNVFRLLETEIYYTLTPVPKAMQKLEAAQPVLVQRFFHQVYTDMEEQHQPLEQSWEHAVAELEKNSCLCREELQAVHSFGLGLGAGDAKEQEKNFQVLMQRLQYALEHAEQCCAQQERVWQYMGVCISVALVLLLF